ncbi:WXG100 family type VII secretion target [Amycolatopsis sp. FBCC-B4732]|uniref:WXG100 family type VII secretion target n=1 Tax=Amycolatopsis sp. FBCC-B4732 TaxID=3079339 RepID=UPI001FF25A23|nr:WXG100 family type VII secretion target [Amycolatopsis sp. FBCC-B4732]UOX86582.1 WXG100 family type VII secretion target [Amycolatopsis sp. FBCC-B4732]
MIAESTTESIPHPLAKQQPVAVAVPQGEDITEAAEPYLGYLTDLARQLGVLDPVETYFRPLIGRWADLGAEADRLRQAASVAAEVSTRLDDQLGRLDAGWEGRDADSFVAYIREIGAAGGDLEEALNVLAGALDELVETVRHVVVDLVEVLVDAADLTSETMLLPSGGARRARAQLEETRESAKALYETARDVMEAFDRLCEGVDDPDAASRSIEIRHRYPQEKFKLHDGALNEGDAADPATPSPAGEATTPSSAGPSDEVTSPSSAEPKHTASGTPDDAQPADAPQPAPAPDHAANQQTSGGVPMMPMMGFGAFGGGGGGRRQPKTRPVTTSSELLGEPGLVAPPVIGEDEKPAPEKKKP